MKLEKLNLKESQIEKDKMATIHGGTSTTVMVEVGYAENEYPDDGTGNPDTSCPPILVEVLCP